MIKKNSIGIKAIAVDGDVSMVHIRQTQISQAMDNGTRAGVEASLV